MTSKNVYIPKPSKSWLKKDEGVKKFFVYILRFEDGDFYVGQTRELNERMLEHRYNTTVSTSGKNPKLQYFEILPSRQSAMIREHEIKALIKNNRREIYRMINSFRDLISKVDLS